ncbi:MAG: hypothetical protein ACLUNZ_08375 [Evtepia sp.]
MIEVKDRIPTKPNRIRIVPETGDPFYAVWERADEPIEEGTPQSINICSDSIDEGGHFPKIARDDIEIDAREAAPNAGRRLDDGFFPEGRRVWCAACLCFRFGYRRGGGQEYYKNLPSDRRAARCSARGLCFGQ